MTRKNIEPVSQTRRKMSGRILDHRGNLVMVLSQDVFYNLFFFLNIQEGKLNTLRLLNLI